MALSPLSRADTVRLIEALAPRASHLRAPAVVERIWQMSEGNPLVIAEAVRIAAEGRWPAVEELARRGILRPLGDLHCGAIERLS